MSMSEQQRSCFGPSRLAYHSDLRSLQCSKPQKKHRSPFEWTELRGCSDILPDALSGPHHSQQPSFSALSSRAIFFLWIRLSFIQKTHALRRLFSNCHEKKLFLWATIRPDFIKLFTFRFRSKTKTLKAKVLYSSHRTISVCELLQIVGVDSLWT